LQPGNCSEYTHVFNLCSRFRYIATCSIYRHVLQKSTSESCCNISTRVDLCFFSSQKKRTIALSQIRISQYPQVFDISPRVQYVATCSFGAVWPTVLYMNTCWPDSCLYEYCWILLVSFSKKAIEHSLFNQISLLQEPIRTRPND
jgi:hypothetical protein